MLNLSIFPFPLRFVLAYSALWKPEYREISPSVDLDYMGKNDMGKPRLSAPTVLIEKALQLRQAK